MRKCSRDQRKGLETPCETCGFTGSYAQGVLEHWLDEAVHHHRVQRGTCLHAGGDRDDMCQSECVIYDYTTCYARRNHSCVTSALRSETFDRGLWALHADNVSIDKRGWMWQTPGHQIPSILPRGHSYSGTKGYRQTVLVHPWVHF